MLETPEVQESRKAPNARCIDTHTHLVPDFYRLWLADKGVDAGGLPIPTWSVESTLQFMQTNEIETSIHELNRVSGSGRTCIKLR